MKKLKKSFKKPLQTFKSCTTILNKFSKSTSWPLPWRENCEVISLEKSKRRFLRIIEKTIHSLQSFN